MRRACFDKLSTWLEDAASRPIAAGLHLAAVDAAGEFGRPAGGQDARLLHPVLALDASLEVERLADAVDVLGGPVGDLLVADHAQLVELLLDQHTDAADALEILEPRALPQRADALSRLGRRRRALVDRRPDRPQHAQIGAGLARRLAR